MEPIQKLYRSDQIRLQILKDISENRWSHFLPSERHLSAQYGVGRDQVHRAIVRLRDDGHLRMEGKRNQILEGATAGLAGSGETSIQEVVVLTSTPLAEANTLFLFIIDQLKSRLLPNGVQISVEPSRLLQQESPDASLELLVQSHGESVWMLHGANPAVQQWFLNKGLRCMVLGSGIPSIPSLDIDHGASMKHAVSVMQRRKWATDRLIFIRPSRKLIGFERMEQAFIQSAGEDASRRVIRYGDNPGDLIRCFKKLPWKHQPRPSGVIVSSSRIAIRLASWLPSEVDLQVGRDVALLSIVDNIWLSHLHPSIAHYSMRSHRYTTPLVRMVMKMIQKESLGNNQQQLIPPDFVEGGSL